jgi:peroxisomal 2,4-dienoyl-CoA reductase
MIFRPDLLKGRVALVTGGGTGIGFGIADLLARAGADVAIASRRPAHLEPARERLAVHGARVLALETNVREPETIRDTVARVSDELGRLDILVNNAAGNFYAPATALSRKAWSAVVETDLYGTFFASQAVHPVMQRQGGGRIISISMTLHYRGWPLMAHATAAKAGVDAITRTLALEWAGDHITVNAIAPGPIPTEGATSAFERPRLAPEPGGAAPPMNDEMLRQIPLGRWGRPEDVANMVVYLASPAGDWITGAIFVVDGGSWLAR